MLLVITARKIGVLLKLKKTVKVVEKVIRVKNNFRCLTMAAKDKFHDIVKIALIKDNWRITHDPLLLKFGQYDQIQVDLGAEKMLGAEKEDKK